MVIEVFFCNRIKDDSAASDAESANFNLKEKREFAQVR